MLTSDGVLFGIMIVGKYCDLHLKKIYMIGDLNSGSSSEFRTADCTNWRV